MHAKFICGITGIVRADDGRVLLLRHGLWPAARQWGFPTGYANTGERHEDARLFRADDLPTAMPELHRELAAR